MGKYTVTSGQNIYDVSLHIYGSVEGIVDLMMNNTKLSLADILKAGDELEYTDDFVINKDIVAYFKMNGIIPSNGERNVYYKHSNLPKFAKILIDNKKTSVRLSISGSGKMEIDWGDDTYLQRIVLTNELQSISHHFNNGISGKRKIIIYGSVYFKLFDCSEFETSSIILFQPIPIEKLILKDVRLDIDFISLLTGVYDMDFSELRTNNLLPLLNCKQLMRLNLSDVHVTQETLDEYLIALVNQYYGRRNCCITLTKKPSGEYREPMRDENLNYILSSGMEAVWVLVNEPAWNEGGYWKFIINNEIYTLET